MGLTAVDLPVDSYIATASSDRNIRPPAIYLRLSKEELEEFYGVYQGSGGSLSGFFSTTVSGGNNVPAQVQSEPTGKLATVVQEVCTAFGLTKDELAQVCRVSRKTLYNWIDGKATPRKATMDRVFALSIIAQAWKQSGFSNDRVFLYRPVLDGLSIFDLLIRDSLDKELILFAGSRLNLSTPTRKAIEDPFA